MDWISKSIKESEKLKDHYKLHHIDFFIKDKLPENINIKKCIYAVSRSIPPHLLKAIDIIYIGKFDFLDKMNFSALYKDGAIYLSNEQQEDSDVVNDLIHEIAHSNEYLHSDLLYSDGSVIKEFLGKRKKLFYFLKAEGLVPPQEVQTEIDFNSDLDNFFYKQVGYGTLSSLTNGLFSGPYSITSIREYFATGFEEYFQGYKKRLKTISPVLYSKIEELNDLED